MNSWDRYDRELYRREHARLLQMAKDFAASDMGQLAGCTGYCVECERCVLFTRLKRLLDRYRFHHQGHST